MIGPDVYSFDALWRHYRNCRRNKRNTINAIAFEADAEAKLLELQHDLREHTYHPGRSICFVTRGPKPREVFAADFRDRIVHHLLVWHLERVFEPRFIHDSYACRPGKGTLQASDRLMSFLRRVTSNGHRPAWALKLDVASFFTSIHKATLCAIIERHVRHPELRWLTRTILFHDPTMNYRFRSVDARTGGPDTDDYPVPDRKSLFGKQNVRGLPIGNLTSQFWANVYLNELDQFVKRNLKCNYYLRYVDDLVLLSEEHAELVRWRMAIEEFLQRQLKLQLRGEGTEPFPVSRGVDFVGWNTWWNRRLPRRQTLGNLRIRLGRFERAAVRPVCRGRAMHIDLRRTPPPPARQPGSTALRTVDQLGAVLASYSGHLRHGAALREWIRLWGQYPWLALLFQRCGWQVSERWQLARIGRMRCLQDQYPQLVRRAGDCLVFCRVGRFFEFYGPQRLLAEEILGLRSVYLPRAGFAFTAGFPVALLDRFTRRALQHRVAVVVVAEQDVPVASGRKRRRPVAVFMPC